MSANEPTTMGVSEATHPKLQRLRDDGHFREMVDAYRFGIALGLAQGVTPPEISARTVFSVATVDPDGTIKNAVEAILGDKIAGGSVYRMAERLADWGVQELSAQADRGEIDLVALFDQVNASDAKS